MRPTITAYDWVPDFARGQVRDLRVRWALKEAGQPDDVRYLKQDEQKRDVHRAAQPFGQVPTYEEASSHAAWTTASGSTDASPPATC